MVGNLYYVEVVLYDENCVALIAQLVQNFDKLVDVRCVQTRGRLIKNLYGFARRTL